MHSNLAPWDFFKRASFFEDGLNSIALFDTYLWSFVHEKLNTNDGIKWKNVFASELTIDSIESSLNNLNLFEMDNYILVHEAEKLSKQVQEWILENSGQFAGKTYLFIFQSKPAWRKKWLKVGNHITVDAPKFWEQTETLKLLGQLMKVEWDYSAIKVFIDRVPFSWGEYVRALEDICGGESIKIDEQLITEFFQNQKLDKFHLAELIANKRLKEFWDDLLNLDLSTDELRDVFVFIHSHLFKMINKEEIESKPKTNKYEKAILAAASKWSKKELLEMLKQVNEWEFRLKAQDIFLLPELKLNHLRA